MPAIDVFVTSILSNPQLRGRHERVRRALGSVRVPYAEHDVAGDENAKSLWKRKNYGKNELPFILVDGEPVGNIEELDEAVEFGELRQFLRLDSPPAPPPVNPDPATSDSSPLPVPPSTITTRTPPPPPKPSLDDFADLDLSEAELAELAREISLGDTFSSGLGSSHDPAREGYDFSHATRRFEGSTAPLKIEKINFTRALPDRPLASDVVRDELEGIEQGDLDIDELEQLAKELEAEELERRRLRDAQVGTGTRGIDPPPLPEKEESVTSPPLPDKNQNEEDEVVQDESPVTTLPKEVAESTSFEGMGGASLSAPLAEIEQLRISTLSPSDVRSTTLTLESPVAEDPAPPATFSDSPPPVVDRASTPSPPPPAPASTASAAKSLFSSVTDALTPRSSSGQGLHSPEQRRPKSTPTEIEHLKRSLELGTAAAVAGDEAGGGGGGGIAVVGGESELPSFGVSDMVDPERVGRPKEEEEEEEEAGRPEYDDKDDDDDAETNEDQGSSIVRREQQQHQQQQQETASLEDRVAQAVRGGDL